MAKVYDEVGQRWVDEGSEPVSVDVGTDEPMLVSAAEAKAYADTDFGGHPLDPENQPRSGMGDPRLAKMNKLAGSLGTSANDLVQIGVPLELAKLYVELNMESKGRALNPDLDLIQSLLYTYPGVRELALRNKTGFWGFMNAYAPSLFLAGMGGAVSAAAGAGSGAAAGAGSGAAASTTAASPTVFEQIVQGLEKGAVRGAAQGALMSASQGQNPIKGAAVGGIKGGVSGGVVQGAVGAANAIPDWFDADIDPELGQVATDWEDAMIAERGMLDAGPMLSGALASPGSVSRFLGTVPEAVPGTTLPIGGTGIDITAPGAIDIAAAAGNLISPRGMLPLTPTAPSSPEISDKDFTEIGDVDAQTAESGITSKEVVGYAKQAKSLYDLYKAITGTTGDVPEFEYLSREEWQEGQEGQEGQVEQSDEDYLTYIGESAVEYLSLDPTAMREAGLKPGTPEYLNYILEQADSIIEQIFGADPSALLGGESVEDLQAALKDLTEQEAQQLTRALYVRGALGQLSFQLSATDPFTGISEELGLLSGEQAEGSKAAHQRGIARSVEGVARLRGREARSALGGMLDRKADLFNLQSSADARKLQAQLIELMDEEERKRRGITSAEDVPLEDESFFKDVLENADPRALERLLDQIGSRDRQGAAVEHLFGRRR